MEEKESPGPIPLKLYFPRRGVQIGIAAKSLHHLRQLLRAKLGPPERYKLTLDDGTIVCDPEYFKLLEHQTKLTVVEASPNAAATRTSNELSRTACFNGERKRPAASAPSAAKRVRLSPEDCSRSVDRTDLNSNHNNSQLLSKICISSVAGDVPMSPVSPQSSGECAPLSPPVQPQLQQTAQKPPCSEPPAQRIQPVQSCPQQATLIQRQKQLPVHLPHQTTAVHPNQAFTVSPANHPILNHHVQWMQHGPLEQQRLTHMPQFNNVPQPHRMIPPGPPQMIPPGPHQVIPPGPHQMIPPGPHQIIPPGPHQIVFRQQVPVRHPIPLYPPIYHHRFNQEQLYQMQVEQQMRTTIQMSHSPHFTPQMPPPPPPPPPPPTHIPARPATQAPPVHGGDCSHTIQRVDQLHPSAPPVLLKVLSPDNTANPTEQSSTVEPTVAKITAVTLNTTLQQQQLVQKRPMSECPVSVVEHLPQQQTLCHVPPLHFPQLSRSQLVAAPQSHTIISPNQLDARITISTENQEAVAVEDSDSEDEHALHIDEGEMSRSPPSPQPPASPEIHSPVEDTVEKERPAKLDLQTQPDDGYCSTTASTLDSADDVKHVLPFANFGDFIPLHSCSDEDRREEDKELEPENNDLDTSSTTLDNCLVIKGTGVAQSEPSVHQQQETTSDTESSKFNDGGDHTVGDLVHSLDHVESLVVTLPIKVIDGQIYYHHNGDKINQPFQARRKEPIVTESEDSSDVDSVTQVVKSRTDRFSLNLDIPTEVESVTETLADCETSQSALVNEDVIVAEHGAEVPVVTTPLHCEIDIQQCVADIIGVMEKEIHNQRPPLVTKEMSSMSSTLHTLPDSGHLQSGDDVMSGAMVEESVLLDSSDLHDDLVMGNEVVLSLEGSSQSYDLVDYNELLSSLLLHSCLPKNGVLYPCPNKL